MATNIHVGNIGTQIRITVNDGSTAIDLSSATLKQIWLRKPNGTVSKKTASFYTDGTDGILTYTSVADDFDLPGVWTVQVYYTTSTTAFYTNIQTFRVYANLE